MPTGSLEVAIILDSASPEFETLAAQMPVWIANGPGTKPRVSEFYATRAVPKCHTAPGAVTTFDWHAETAEEALLGLLDDVDLHHGKYSADPAYRRLRVVGVRLTPAVREAFSEFGFTAFDETPSGFIARRNTDVDRG